ncbi:MAG TPA: hypothetical protein VGM53_29040 [Streptosporangiaceae bacterium]
MATATGQAAANPAPGSGPPGAASGAAAGAGRHGGSTPRVIGLLMVTLVVASLAWGVVGAWVTGSHASAASGVLNASEPLSFEARQMYQALSDADVTATTAFLTGPDEALPMRQRYQADVAQAAADLSALRAAAPSGQFGSSLPAVATGLPAYTGYVAQAQSDYALGYQLTGGSFMQVASEQMHLVLLPAARTAYLQANTELAARSAQATGLPWMAVLLVVSVVLAVVLWRTQRWLSRQTRRTFNVGLVAGSLALIVVTVWLAVAFAGARSDLQDAETHGSAPAEALAQATITIQRARGDEILNLISRTGAASFLGDFDGARRQAGPGPGTLLATAAAGSQGAAASQVAAAGRDARAWYAVGARVFGQDVAANYAAETSLVTGHAAGDAAPGFARLEGDLGRAIASDQAVFSSRARAGADGFTGLVAGFVVATVIMAIGCAWGLSQRLAEYR